MRVLVTGGAGFIGRHLVGRLLARGDAVTVLDWLSPPDSKDASPPLPRGAELIRRDVASPETWQSIAAGDRFHVVYHLAASFANAKSIDDPAADAQANILGTLHAARFANASRARFVYAGSSSSYGIWPGRPFRENDPPAPGTPYALSKLVGEQYTRMLCPAATIVRLFNVYGPGDPPGLYRNALPNMIAAAITRRQLSVFGKDSTRDFTHVDDAVSILLDAASASWSGKLVNICTGVETSVLEIARQIAGATGAQIAIEPRRAWDNVARRCGDNTLLQSLRPTMFARIEDRLKEVIDDVSNHIASA